MTVRLPSDEELIEMAGVFDEFFYDFCQQFEMSPLSTSGLMLARMSKLAKEVGYFDQYKRLMTEIAILNETSQTIVANNASTSIH